MQGDGLRGSRGRSGMALTAFVLLAPVSNAAYGQQNADASYRSGYFLGRGDTGIATVDNEDAIFYNPAGIAQGKGLYKRAVLAAPQVEMSQATRDLVKELSAKNANAVDTAQNHIGKPNHLGVSEFSGLILRRAALGAFTTNNVDVLAYDDPKAGGLEAVHASASSTTGATFTLADKVFHDQIMIGATAKYLERGRGDLGVSAADAALVQAKLKDQKSFMGTGQGGGGDIGLMYQGGGRVNPSFGLVINDVGDTKIKPAAATALNLDLKQSVNLGVAIEPGTQFSKFKLLADYHDALGKTEPNVRKRLHLGGELSVLGTFGVTGGLNQGYPTAGLYADIWLVRLDLAMYTEELGDRVGTRPDTRYLLRLRLGF